MVGGAGPHGIGTTLKEVLNVMAMDGVSYATLYFIREN